MSNKIKKFDGTTDGSFVGGSFIGNIAAGLANPELGMVKDAQYTDAVISAIEEGRLPGGQTQFRYGFTDNPLMAAIDYDRRIKEIEAVGGDASQLKEALTTIQDDYKENQDIVDYLADIGLQQEAAADPTLADKAADAVGKAQGAITTAGTAVGSAMDKVFDILRGVGLNIPNPNKAILYPRQGAGPSNIWAGG